MIYARGAGAVGAPPFCVAQGRDGIMAGPVADRPRARKRMSIPFRFAVASAAPSSTDAAVLPNPSHLLRLAAGAVAVTVLAGTCVAGHAAEPAAVSAASAASEVVASAPAAEPRIEPLATPVAARRLPPVGTTWCYSAGPQVRASMTLTGVDGDVATYTLNDAPSHPALKEQIDAYSEISPERHGERRLLAFPLEQGKQWHDTFDQTVTMGGPQPRYRYHLRATATSTVAGTERRTTAAGTFDTIVVVRDTQWTRSAPEALADAMHDEHCATDACTASGASRDVYWYAPALGRAVLRAYLRSGWPELPTSADPDELLHDSASLVTELVGYGPDTNACRAAPPAVLGRLPTTPWPGFAALPNDSWEFLMRRDGMGE